MSCSPREGALGRGYWRMALACGGGSRFLAGFLARAGDMPSPPLECASALSRLISRSCNRCASRKSSLLIYATKVRFSS